MPHALVVDDDADSRDFLSGVVAREGFGVVQADSLKAARAELDRSAPDLLLLDLGLPDGNGIDLMRGLRRPLATDVVLVTGQASIDSAVEGMRLGASDYLTKPVDVDRLVRVLRRHPQPADLKQEIDELRNELRSVGRFGRLFGASAPMQQLYDRIARVAPTSAPVLLIGERGSGKTTVARTLHELSRRKRAPFFMVDCGAVPDAAIETELFGRQTGAMRTEGDAGLLQRAHGGTVLLSHVASLPLATQAKVLHFLEAGEFVPADGSSPVAPDVRIVASTEAPLAAAVEEGTFSADLLQRLGLFPINVAPLRQRGTDVGLLAQHFLDEINRAEGSRKVFARAALTRLEQATWPGNVRELQNFVHRAYLNAGSVIDVDHNATGAAAMEDTDDLITVRIGTPLDEIDRRVTMATLARCGGVKKHAAATLGISLKTLYNRLEAYAARDAARTERANA